MSFNVQPLMTRSADLDDAAEGGAREWFTAAELAELALPGLPTDKRSLNRRARDENWHLKVDSQGEPLARPRSGRGGGIEYHLNLLPGSARLALRERGITANEGQPLLSTPEEDSRGRWRWYEAQSAKTKAEAERRMSAIAEIELLQDAGYTSTAAVAEVARRTGQSTTTLWNWRSLIDGVAHQDRLPAIAPRFTGGGKAAEIDPEIWELFKSDMLRPSCPTINVCYVKAAAVAEQRGISLPSKATFKRRFEREVPKAARLLARKGPEALRRSLPAIRRSVDELHALQLVNMDGHKFDVFVEPPPGYEHLGKKIRPILIGIQDVYSRKLLAWRIGTTESAGMTRLVFADLFRIGLPAEVYLDNGMAFASKWISGGSPTRNRYKIKAEEPTGLLVTLGIKVHFTLPYRGQSKPIERAWRELCEFVAKGALCDGAYTGNSPANKPHNHNKRIVPWADFVDEVGRMINLHNALTGRRGGICRGRSFDEVFAESFATAPVRKANESHMRAALLTAETVRLDRATGEIKFHNNRYYASFCNELHGERVIIRFDPDDLHRPIYVYGLDGRYLGEAPIWDDAGFADVEGAKRTAKLYSDARQAARDLVDANRRLSAAEVAAMQSTIGGNAPELPEPKVIRPVRHRGQTAAAIKAAKPEPFQAALDEEIVAALGRVNLRIVE